MTTRLTFSNCQLNAQFLYSITIYMLHYNPQHVSSSTLLTFRRTNCIITAHFLYSITIYVLHYNPQHVSSSTLLIFRRTNCIITAHFLYSITIYMLHYNLKHVYILHIQDVPGGMDKTSGQCSLC